MPAHSAGKGSDYRKVDQKKYADTLDRVFGHKCPSCSNYMEKLGGMYRCAGCESLHSKELDSK